MCALVTGVQTCALPIFSAAANRFGGSCMSTVLVTGAFGNVGRSVVRHLLEAGHHVVAADLETPRAAAMAAGQIGRASCRERGCQYVSISVVAVSLKQQNKNYNNQDITNKIQ